MVALIDNYFGSYLLSKYRYAGRMLKHRLRGQPRVCPYCGPASPISLLHRKKVLVEILQCEKCKLIFRWPADTLDELDVHYDREYAEAAPQVRLPDTAQLPALIDADFKPIFRDLSDKISVLKSIAPDGRVLDYGCSWGYATRLLQKNGYDASGFEISKTRAGYARKQLGMPVMDSLAELDALPGKSFDIIYSNHVLEHLPSIGNTLALFARLLTDRGLAFHILPNFTGKTARSGMWLNWIGEDHPIAPNTDFFEGALRAAGFGNVRFASSPFDLELRAALRDPSIRRLQTDGDELLIIAYKG